MTDEVTTAQQPTPAPAASTDLATATTPAEVAACLRAALARYATTGHGTSDARWAKTLVVLGEAAKTIEKTAGA